MKPERETKICTSGARKMNANAMSTFTCIFQLKTPLIRKFNGRRPHPMQEEERCDPLPEKDERPDRRLRFGSRKAPSP
jgi:hypothetical protein